MFNIDEDHFEPRHIGDGVYVKYDGFHLILMANSPSNPTDTIYLDHYVRSALSGVLNEIKERKNV